MEPTTLTKAWNSTRDKQTRLQIIDNAYCPNDLIIKALFLYDPNEVLDLPNLSFKAIWGKDSFIQTCFEIKNHKFGFRPKGYSFNSGSVENKLLLYLETIYAKTRARQLQCMFSLNNKHYIKKLVKLKPELISLAEQPSHLSLSFAFHLYSKDVIPLGRLEELCQVLISEESPDWITDFVPEFSVIAVNSIKKLCALPTFQSKLFYELFKIFIAGTDFTLFILKSRLREMFKKEIGKYKPEWVGEFCREIRGFFN